MATVVFTRRRNIGSLLLRTFLWSEWSHCGILYAGKVVEAAAFKGVRVRPLEEFLADVSKYEVVEFPGASEAIYKAALTQLGKAYDWMGCLGFVARRRWQDTDKWFCSELIAWAFEKAGLPLFRTDYWRITPRDLFIAIRRDP